jgi:carboxyl-terminal processing protease
VGGRALLLAISAALALLVVGGGLGVHVGAADTRYGPLGHFTEVLDLVMANYVDPVDPEQLLEGAYAGMLTGLDAQGAYLTADEVAQWRAGSQVPAADPGLAVLKASGALEVVAVEPGSPASRAGIVPRDHIRSIDGHAVRDLSIEQTLALLRGRAGSKVRLALLRSEQEFRIDELELERQEHGTGGYELDVRQGIAIVGVRDLARLDPAKLAGELEGLSSKGVDRLLVDLRNVVELDARKAGNLAGLFVSGSLLELRNREGSVLELVETSGARVRWSGSLALLVNRATAGAAEAATRVLQSRRGATVFGESTYGMGAEPRLFELPKGGGLLLSAAVWQTPSGERWNGTGIEPDHPIPRAEGRAFRDALEQQLQGAIDAFASQTSRQQAA